MGVGLLVGQELPFTPRGPPVICLLKVAGVGGGGTAPQGTAGGGHRGLSGVASRHWGGEGHSGATAISGGPSRVWGGLHSPAEGPTSSGSSSGGGKGCQWWRGGTRCSPSTHSPRPTRRTRSVSLGQAGGGGCTRRGFSSAGIWLPADGGTAAAVISGAN